MEKKKETKETSKKATPYVMFRWGPCLIKFQISENNRKAFLEEAKLSTKDWSRHLAGVGIKEVAFRDYTKFEKFFSSAFEIYNEAFTSKKKWTGSEWTDSKDEDNERYQLNALWCNFQRPGDFNPPHDHADTLSFVIFLDVPDKLVEENKAYKGQSAGPGGLTFIYGDGTREAVTNHSFFPKAGDMYIFPAWLKHWVYPFKSDCTRISVSGNVTNAIKIKNLAVRTLPPNSAFVDLKSEDGSGVDVVQNINKKENSQTKVVENGKEKRD